jgi:predicted DNA-binding transcriptional regulator AlpA
MVNKKKQKNSPRAWKHPRKLHLDQRASDFASIRDGESDDDLLTTAEVSVWLGVSVPWVEIGRHRGYGPPYIRYGPKSIRYLRGAVRQWLEARTHRSTAEYRSDNKIGDGPRMKSTEQQENT